MMRVLLLCYLLLASWMQHAQTPAWVPLFNGRNLDGWVSRGDGQWTVTSDGILVGQRVFDRMLLSPAKYPFKDNQAYLNWLNTQAWLYTTREFENFDLHVEFWTRTGGNSGISIRDPSRAAYAIATPPDFTRTPARLGYEIQINNRYPDPTPTGSVYTFVNAARSAMREDDWNALDVEARQDKIRVLLNDKLVAETACDPKRPSKGPIGLQLHDQFSLILFRNIRIRVH